MTAKIDESAKNLDARVTEIGEKVVEIGESNKELTAKVAEIGEKVNTVDTKINERFKVCLLYTSRCV